MKDVVIIGSGAGGGPLALRLSQAGLDVLVLERGPRYLRADYAHDEVYEAEHPDFFVPSVASDPHVLVEAGGTPQLSNLGWIACCVGGGTAHMGGSLYRFHPDDFRLHSRCGAYEELADWPYDYAALEPYYAEAEWELGVSGTAGSNPFEGPRSRPYPMPPLVSHPFAHRLDAACARLGWHPFPTPKAINSEPYGGRPACAYCPFCAGSGCAVGARGSTQEALLPRAERTGRCEVRAQAMVREITVDAAGRASGCVYLDAQGRERRERARVVCVCASAVESARLLLASRSVAHPDGLANSSGLVGRHLQFHLSSTGRATFELEHPAGHDLRDPHPVLMRSVMDDYFFVPGSSPLPKGGLYLFELERVRPLTIARQVAAQGENGPLWGLELRRRLRRRLRETRDAFVEVFHDFVPNRGTFMELDPDVRDQRGLPVARIHLAQPEHHTRAGGLLLERALRAFEDCGAVQVTRGAVGYVSHAMVHGTCRAGRDPARSVLNEFCQTHEVDNLFVVDGSFMPTSGGAPSTLTIVANSFRTADYLLERVRTGDLH